MRFTNFTKRAPSTKVLLFMVLVDLLSLSSGQNCAVPKIVIVKQNDSLTETLVTGEHLKTIKVKNVEGISSVHQMPPNYTSVEFNPNSSELTLNVETPLWRMGQTEKSFIDEEMVDCINVVVELICADGRNKDVAFRIPIVDKNTQVPRFEHPSYELKTEPCLMDRCTLIFTKDIVVIDEDRDRKNAEMTITTTNSPGVNILSSDVHSLDERYAYDKVHKRIKHFGYQIKIKLEIEVGKANISYAEPFSFDLEAVNVEPYADSQLQLMLLHVARTSVSIKFMEFGDRKIAPVFTSSVYFMCVGDPKKDVKVFPEDINATIPGMSEDDSEIRYELRGDRRSKKILQINSLTGVLQFSEAFDEHEYKRLISCVIEYELVAIRKTYNETIESFAALIIYFPELDKTEPPPDPTTTTTTSPTDSPTYATTEGEGNEMKPELPTTEPELPTTTESSDPINSTTLPPSQTTLPPSQTTLPPSQTTLPPSQTTLPPSQTTYPPSQTTLPPNQTTLPPSQTTLPPSQTTLPPSQTTLPPSQTTLPPSQTTYPPSQTTLPPNQTTLPPSQTTLPPNQTTLPPSQTTLPPSQTTLPPSQTTYPPNQTIGLPIQTTLPPNQTIGLPIQTTAHPPLPPPPIRPPDHCTCDCMQFSCKSSREPSILSGVSFHADPYYCTKYHQCSKRDDNDDYDQSTVNCPTHTIFCPNMSECLSVEECLTKTGVNMTSPQPHLETGRGSEISFVRQEGFCGNWSCTCFQGIWPGEPGNLCNASNHMDLIEDPNHCDIFHQCQPLEDPHSDHFIDYPKKCPKGLIYCHDLRDCTYPTDTRCHCNKTFKHCDVYEMGRWENFDIFNKTFKPNFTLKYLFSLFG